MTTPPEYPEQEHHVAAEHVEKLAAANDASNKTLLNLVQRVAEDARIREKKVQMLDAGMKQTRMLLIMLGIGLILLVGLGIANFANIAEARRNAEVVAHAAKDAKGTYDLLYGCFQPDSDCAKRSAQQQKVSLDEIKKYELTGFYCARTNPAVADPNGDAFIECMNRLYPGGPQLNDR